MLQQSSDWQRIQESKISGWWNFCMTLCLLAQLTLRLIPASAENLLVDSLEDYWYSKYQYFCRNNSVLGKIKDSLFCVTNHCSKVLRFYNTSKRILPSLSE